MHPFPPPAVWTRKGYPFPPSKKSSKFRNARLSGIRSVQYRNEQKCRCQNQSGIVIRRPSPEPECCGTGLRCRISYAGGIALDAGAQLCG